MNTTNPASEPGTPSSGSTAPAVIVAVVAIAVLVIYVVFIVLGWKEVETDNADTWARRIMLFGGIEALAFAAAGWLFGREVGREAAKDAKADKEKAQQEASSAKAVADAAKSDALRLASKVTQSAGGIGVASSGSNELNSLAAEIEHRWSVSS